MYEVEFEIRNVVHKQTVNAGSEDEAYYTISGLYPTDKVKILSVRKVGM